MLKTCLAIVLSLFTNAYVQSQQTKGDEDEVAKLRFELFEQSALALQIKPVGRKEAFRLQKSPLQKFTAADRVYGTVFAWTDEENRLAMIGTLGSLPIGGNELEFIELHLTKPTEIEPVSVAGFPSKTWSPKSQGLKPILLEAESKIGKTPSQRLIEMRSLIRDFRAEQHHEGKTEQLRLLPQPLYRMANSTPEQDEALFAFVGETGTDPEVLVRLAILESEGLPRWHYQSLRFNWREQFLFYKDSQVWHVEEFLKRDASLQETPYLTGLTKILD